MRTLFFCTGASVRVTALRPVRRQRLHSHRFPYNFAFFVCVKTNNEKRKMCVKNEKRKTKNARLGTLDVSLLL